MMNICRSIALFLLPLICASASIDAIADRTKIELSFLNRQSNPANIVINYNSPGSKTITSISVTWNGTTAEIPREEIDGIDAIQTDSIMLCYGVYHDGKPYHYIKAFFGPPVKEAFEGYHSVWFLFSDTEYIKRETFINIQKEPKFFIFDQLSEKLKGKPPEKT